ncbi:MAG: DUF4173 domain-containing protein [Flavobacteriales bacterium]|nr:DUF4173 domain-containing protein [Flavobacteriales bacterium]MCB9196329.1 DUF4173 domain-containing protein [Flavobacteriales bacterium]
MKTTDKIILISGLLFGILFYQQAAGINFFIFSLLQVVGIFFTTPKERKTRNWWLVFAGANLSALGILMYGSLLGVWTNFISLFVLASISIEPKSSLVITLFHNLYTVSSGVVHIMTDLVLKVMETSGWKRQSRFFKNMVIVVVSFGIAMIFVVLYRNSNVAFKDLTNRIDLSFISLEWIIFTMFGYYLVYLMYRPRNIAMIHSYDLEAEDVLDNEKQGLTAKWLSIQSEQTWANTLLTMLNVVLLVVLGTELTYELGLSALNEKVGYSENVHTGVNALIFSIILAVALILFFFQGRLNFVKENTFLRAMALIWVAQNVLLVMLTGYKNWIYVEEYFLTYKRIGVFIYLICCLVGLIYTYLKVSDAKSNWYLVRRVGWTIYAVLLITPIIDWDHLIINYNFSKAETKREHLDVNYLLTLPAANYPLIFEKLEPYKDLFPEQWQERNYYLGKLYRQANEQDWRSFNFRTFHAVHAANNNKYISYEY